MVSRPSVPPSDHYQLRAAKSSAQVMAASAPALVVDRLRVLGVAAVSGALGIYALSLVAAAAALVDDVASKACSKSAMRSSMCSQPTETRMSPP